MNLAWVSLLALLLAVVVSCTTQVNVGLIALTLAWVIGAYLAPLVDQTIGVKGVIAGFPGELFLTLVGSTALFMLATVNGTLGRVAERAVRACRGNTGAVPLMFFAMTMLLSAIGAGNIAAAALIAPMAMAVAARSAIPPFLMALMVGHGSVAGGLSPVTPLGIITQGALERVGLANLAWHAFLSNMAANVAVAIGGYFIFGGWKLFRRTPLEAELLDAGSLERRAELAGASVHQPQPAQHEVEPFTRQHWVTLAVIAVLMVGVVFAKVHVGLGAIAAAVLLIVLRMADEQAAIRQMPWGVMITVCGMTTLVALVEKTGGLDLCTQLLAQVTSPALITGAMALLAGVVSVFSSTSGVVLPAFLPLVPGLVEKLGGGDPAAIASSIVVGGNLVDVSPVSTIGALCVAAATVAPAERQALFMRMLIWGLSMSLVGAALSQIFLR